MLYFGALHLNLFVPNIQFYKYSAALPLIKWFLLIPGDPSLATFAEASVAETLWMTGHLGVKRGKKWRFVLSLSYVDNFSTNRHFFPPPSNPNSYVIPS